MVSHPLPRKGSIAEPPIEGTVDLPHHLITNDSDRFAVTWEFDIGTESDDLDGAAAVKEALGEIEQTLLVAPGAIGVGIGEDRSKTGAVFLLDGVGGFGDDLKNLPLLGEAGRNEEIIADQKQSDAER